MFRKILTLLMVLYFLIFSSTSSNADLVEWELPNEFFKEYNYNDPLLSLDFDVGVNFSSISHVYIDCAGSITGGTVQMYHPQTLAPIGDPFPEDVGIIFSLGFNPGLRSETLWGGAITYSDPEPFDLVMEIERPSGTTWSDLLDGKGTISFQYNEYIILYGGYIEHGNVVFSDATLIIYGTVSPEPTTFLLLATGLFGIIPKHKRKR